VLSLKKIHEARVWQVRNYTHVGEIARTEADESIKSRAFTGLREALDQLKCVRTLKEWKTELGRDPPALPADVAPTYRRYCVITGDEADHGSR